MNTRSHYIKLLIWTNLICMVAGPHIRAATQGEIKVGKIWVHPNASNYGYIGNIEYPGGSNDYYILQLSMMFSCTVQDEKFVFFGGALGQSELDYSIQEADDIGEDWTQQSDGRSISTLNASGNFSDLMSTVPLNLNHSTTIHGYNHPDYDDGVFLTHTFRNESNSLIEDFYFGYHMPADVGASGVTTRELDDYAAYDLESGVAYMFDDDGDNGLTPYFVGQVLLSAPPVGGNSDDGEVTTQSWTTFNYYLMVNPISGRDDLQEKLTANVIDVDASSKGPYTVISGVGPYSILAGGEISFTVAVVFGEGLDGLISNVLSASEIVANGFNISQNLVPPQVPEIESIEVSGKLVLISWDSDAESSTDFIGYRIYRSQVSAIGAWEILADVESDLMGNSLLDLNVQVGFPYFYTITSYDMDGNESGKWAEVCRTLDSIKPLNNSSTKMDRIRVVPNPYLGGASWELQDYESTIYFTRLPKMCSIYIYTVTGELVAKLEHNMDGDQSWDDSGDESWDLLSRNRQSVASGLYLYRVVSSDGEEHTGRFAIVRGER